MNESLVRNVFSVGKTLGTANYRFRYLATQSEMSDQSSRRALCWGNRYIFTRSLSNPVIHLCQRFDVELDEALRCVELHAPPCLCSRWQPNHRWSCSLIYNLTGIEFILLGVDDKEGKAEGGGGWRGGSQSHF